MKRFLISLLLLIGLSSTPILKVYAQSNPPVVHAVLFYSPTCGHCEFVINQTLVPMINQYGNQLQILGVDISQQQGYSLFAAALQKFGLDRGGVPFLVIDNIYLMGSQEIPERFPGLVETYLAQGGLDWPNLPGLDNIIPTQTSPSTTTPEVMTALPITPPASPLATHAPESNIPASSSPTTDPLTTLTHQEKSTWRERFAHDPAGNTLAVIVLVGMIGALAWGYRLFQNTKGASLKDNWSWAIPVLCVVGFGVAGYLAYVETAQVQAVCGPVGDCNTVQQSEYARLFGILPIGVLGLVGYAAIIISWLVARFTAGRPANLAPLAILGMTVFGTLFSVYLTFLEPFVIGATCAWCLTSAVLMTVLMMLSIAPAKPALAKLGHKKKTGKLKRL
ncbi:MAG: vitamin K epoxide reductase [Anaerolineaceae bacterium]|nr:MAG: vitamin K epoxide reductase [Anaerolineaceae bacterium]